MRSIPGRTGVQPAVVGLRIKSGREAEPKWVIIFRRS